MPLVSEMALPELPIHQADFTADPEPYMAAARARHPWLARCELGYLVHGHQAIADLMPMDDKLTPSMEGIVGLYGGHGTEWGRFQQEQILGRWGEAHLRIRNSAAEAFLPRNVKKFRPLVQKVVSGLLDEWAPKKQFDFSLFASYFPVTVICGLLGTSPEPIPRIREALETQSLVTSLNPDLLPALQAGFAVLWSFVDGLVIDRERSGVVEDGSLLDSLIAAKRQGRLSETELRDLLIILFVAGYGTSKTLLGVIMHMMLTHPEEWKRCAEDLAYCAKVVEEMLRHTSIANAVRTAAEEIEYDSVVFPKGSVLIFVLSKSGRDPAVFSDPMEFRPERVSEQRYLAFGRGAHICLGQHLARLQIAEGLNLIARRLANPRLAGEVGWRPFIAGGGVYSLPIAFDEVVD
jgi:cytochrome P450